MYTVSFYKLVFLDPETKKKKKDWIYSFLKLTVKYLVRQWHTMEKPAINDKDVSSLPSWKFTIRNADFGFIQHTHFKFVSMHGIRGLSSSQQLNLTILLIFVDMASILLFFYTLQSDELTLGGKTVVLLSVNSLLRKILPLKRSPFMIRYTEEYRSYSPERGDVTGTKHLCQHVCKKKSSPLYLHL